MKSILQTLILVLIFISCSDKKSSKLKESAMKTDTVAMKTDTVLYSYDAGAYSISARNYQLKLDLLSNNKFIRFEKLQDCSFNVIIQKHFGKYTMTDSTLQLTPEKVEAISYKYLSPEKKLKEMLEYNADSLGINTVFRRFAWKNKEYLLSEQYDSLSNDSRNDFQRFANCYSNGKEPNKSGNYFTRTKKDTTTDVKWNINKIPQEYRGYFIKEPISVKIIDRKQVGKDEYDPELVVWQIKVDKGKKDRIKKGFVLTTRKSGDYDYSIEIDSIQDKASFGKCYISNKDEQHFRIGTEMRTKW